MKLIPKKFLGFWVIVVVAIISLVFFLTKDANKSLITIASGENKFFVNFDLKTKDQKNLSKILENLQIPQNSQEDLSFELDSTSSASLAHLIPIKVNPIISTKSISFSGTVSHSPFIEKLSPKRIKVPQDFNLAVFAPNVLDFVTTRNLYPENLVNWLKNNFSPTSGQYLIIFGKNAQFALIVEKTEIDLSSLKSIELSDQSETSYKEEVRADTIFYLMNIISSEGKSEAVTFFQQENWVVFASSREAAFKIADSLQSKNSTDFPSFNFDSDSNFLLFFTNKQGEQLSESFINLISRQNSGIANPNLQKILREVEEINFALKATRFSGLISLK
ncbi:MAG: hypothetical protein UU34_C0010G0012 [Candidatus Curtissbacteria bacterium GW2011_GWA1_41_11]|uniref:DUF3352 domain-containing protein n=1 Tax=Candidatus Curtissbacteria bacterium GW2011_GWA1_41_11 TaxID=1618409 RepID=A0A0G0UCV0_9BACT|nr:MAG: hypothetical protein UU34_C0010G0012 [Candidatus Curtissbacteria bacterium GW2011_GWA1_41_11]